MGLLSVRGRLSRPAGHKSPIRLHSEYSLAGAARRIATLPARLGLAVRAAIRNTGNEAAAAARNARLAAIAATNDAWIVAALLLFAAIALALEMAASVHLI